MLPNFPKTNIVMISKRFKKSAPTTHVSKNIGAIRLATGVLSHLSSHDIRRGALRDIYHLNPPVRSGHLSLARAVAYHANTT